MEPITKELLAAEAANRLGLEGDGRENTISCLLNGIHIDAAGNRPDKAAEQAYFVEAAGALDALPEGWTVERADVQHHATGFEPHTEYGIREPDGRSAFTVVRRFGVAIAWPAAPTAHAASARAVAVALRIAAADAGRV